MLPLARRALQQRRQRLRRPLVLLLARLVPQQRTTAATASAARAATRTPRAAGTTAWEPSCCPGIYRDARCPWHCSRLPPQSLTTVDATAIPCPVAFQRRWGALERDCAQPDDSYESRLRLWCSAFHAAADSAAIMGAMMGRCRRRAARDHRVCDGAARRVTTYCVAPRTSALTRTTRALPRGRDGAWGRFGHSVRLTTYAPPRQTPDRE